MIVKEIETVLQKFRFERNRLNEKKKQYSLMMELYDNNIPKEEMKRLEEFLGREEGNQEDQILEELRRKQDQLAKEVNKLQNE